MRILDKEKEAVKFFQDNREYTRILTSIFKKYKSLGKLTGNFELKDLTQEERRILAPLHHKYFNAQKARVSIKKFVDYFCSGKFEGIDFSKVLAVYFNDNLSTYKKEREEEEREKENFFKEILFINKGTRSEAWLKEVLGNKSFGYSMISKNYETYYKDNKINEFKLFLNNILKGFNSLTFSSDDSESLPIFSSKITKDPHYFDVNKPAGKILIHGICYELKRENPVDAEETAELLYSAGLLKDDISSFTVTFGLKAYKESDELEFIYSFTEFSEPLIFTLGNLSKIDRFLCNKNRLFIFENPSLFSEVVKRTIDLKPSIICTSGQLKLSSLILLDKIIKDVDEIYYSGDFDPEGIIIANKLKMRYGDKLKFWRFSVEDYLKIISHKEISHTSKAKLDNIKNDELSFLIERIREKGLAGYQEMLIEDYIKDIIDMMIV